jgi:nucleoside-diphosphate-sugar epimerase
MTGENHEAGQVFITGATGYLGSRLVPALIDRGHPVKALARPASVAKLPPRCVPVTGDALHGLTYAASIAPARTFIHLIGVPSPSPAKARDFLRVDLASVEVAVAAAMVAGVRHFVYLSVAHPAPVMQTYIAARMRAEEIVRS